MGKTLAGVLNGHLTERGWSFEKLAEAAGLPRNTVYRWTRGEVRRVRNWQDLIKAARALELTRFQANALLATGGHPSIEVLLERATNGQNQDLLFHWALPPPHNNLPAQLTSFVGREKELGHLTRLLSSVRLVTLTGPGGSGKTRLALEMAQAVLDEFEEVQFIDLSSVRDPELAILTISQTLDLKESPDQPPPQALATHLRDRNILLVLDNLEQVIAAAAPLTELLVATRKAKMLVTSRTRLNVRGEHEFAVLPLPVPAPSSGFEEFTLNPAIALFADRARAANPSFSLTPQNAPLVAEICARLDGLPLGIELAAVKTRQLRLGSMLKRFPGKLALASGNLRGVSERQRTLRATIAWSYDLLTHEEQMLFTCIGMFAGGFTEEAARSIYGETRKIDIDVSEGLESLVEQNLVRRTWGIAEEPRYELLETIREYALEKLDERGQRDAVLNAVSDYFLSLAERADLVSEGQAHWLPRLATEHDNFRTVLDGCKERDQKEKGLRLVIALLPLWQLRDHHTEASSWLETFMAAPGAVSPGLWANSLLWQGLMIMQRSGDDVSASRLFDESLTLFREGGDIDGTSEVLQAEADVYRNREQWVCAKQRYNESLTLARQAGNAYLMAHGHLGLAFCAQEEQEFGIARHNWSLMLEWATKAGNKDSTALAVNSLGEMARYREDWTEAERYYQQTHSLARELGSDSRTALALHNLGYVALGRGQIEKAERLFSDSLSLYAGRHHQKGVAECLAGLGRVAAAEDRPESAARLCGATGAILEGLGAQLDTLDRADFERTLDILKGQLGERLQDLLDEGKAMSMECATEYAATDYGMVETVDSGQRTR